jgi:transcriptional regulator with XRE-family HTH domain
MPEGNSMELKSILKHLIKEEGITISQLSKRTQVPVQTLHNWLNGIEPRSLKQVRKVSEYFEVSLDYLCFGVGKRTQSGIENYTEEINAGVFEVVLRRIKKND